MGHGANDKLYITHQEHSGLLGQHAASSGHKKKIETPHPGNLVPFDSCAISLQPFTHPVCARNPDGTGMVFDLLNIVPWLKNHNNTHPISGEPLDPSSLITLHYSRNSKNEINDPVTMKPFSEHSHIVAIATTGNVFLADTVKQFSKEGKDLVSEVEFKKEDIITLQDPHNASGKVLAPIPKPEASKPDQTKSSTAAVAKATGPKTLLGKAAAQPYNVSPYSTGQTGASLTSTAIAPRTETDVALFDEEEMMYDEISRVRKEKDRAKNRAYVRIVTNMGGSLNVELFCEKAPKTCYNFLMLARQGKYNDCVFHRLIPGFMIQGGDPTGTGRGGESYWGTPFRDEYDLKGAEKHTERGMLSMANRGMGTNGSQFFFTFRETPHLDGKHTVFGKLVGGEDILTAMERVPVQPKTDVPLKPIKITEIAIYQDPFEDYKQRLAKKLSRQAASGSGTNTSSSLLPSSSTSLVSEPATKKQRTGEAKRDDVNWFGVKLGAGATESIGKGSGGGGVGKYLNLSAPKSAAPMPAARGVDSTASEDPAAKRKRKLGFGDFSGW